MAYTMYLAACTKGANAASVRRQPFSQIPAKQRAYSLKGSYMTQVFFIESNRIIRKATVARRSGDFYILRFDGGGGIQLREGRIFPTKEQAEATLPGEKVQKKANSPYDYWH